jgi:nitroreductase
MKLRSVRKFDDRPLPEDVLRSILDAGRRAQSSKNTQPWEFIVVQDRDRLTALSKLGTYAGHLAGAAAGVFLVSTAEDSYDVGQATAFLMLAALELGVGSCIAYIHEQAAAKTLLGVPVDRQLIYALSFGFPAADWTPARMGGRRSLEDVVHWESW